MNIHSTENSPTQAPADTVRFSGRVEFLQALDAQLNFVQRQLDVFDPDFSDWQWNRIEVFEQLKRFCIARRNNKLRVLCHSGDILAGKTPRFMQLLRLYGHIIECRQTVQIHRNIQQSLLIADNATTVRRYDVRFNRGTITTHVAEQGLEVSEQFEDMWRQATPGLSATTLGLGA